MKLSSRAILDELETGFATYVERIGHSQSIVFPRTDTVFTGMEMEFVDFGVTATEADASVIFRTTHKLLSNSAFEKN
jgi:hypothetical protein